MLIYRIGAVVMCSRVEHVFSTQECAIPPWPGQRSGYRAVGWNMSHHVMWMNCSWSVLIESRNNK